MASLLYQTIEQISREKHIEPEIIVAAIEDAMVVAARKYYRTEEDLRSRFNPESGQVDVFSVHTVVEEVTDPLREISLGDAKKRQPEIEVEAEHSAPEAKVTQGYLEEANTSVVEEMVNMIVAQRAYEVNSKAVQAADEMLQQGNNLRR